MKIHNSVAFVTGANRGLGLALVRELIERGAKKVYAGMRNPVPLDMVGVEVIRLDVTDLASIVTAADQCGDTGILVNNAGIGRITNSTLEPEMIESARELFETNFYGVIRMCQACRGLGGALVEDEEVGRAEVLAVGEVDQVGDCAVVDGGQDGQQVWGGPPAGWLGAMAGPVLVFR